MGCHFLLQCMKVKSESEAAQSCPTCSDPRDCNLRGSSVHGIFQARVLEWGAIAFSRIILYSMALTHLGDHSSAGHLGCFLHLANTNSAATNTLVQGLLQHLPHLMPLTMLYLTTQQQTAHYALCAPCCFLLLTVGDWGPLGLWSLA